MQEWGDGEWGVGVRGQKGQNSTTLTFSESVQTWMALGMRRAVFSLVMEQISFKRTVSWHHHGDRAASKRGHQHSQAKSVHGALEVARQKSNLSSHDSGPGRDQLGDDTVCTLCHRGHILRNHLWPWYLGSTTQYMGRGAAIFATDENTEHWCWEGL